jgi:lysyl-tRNA synthetase class 2
LKQKNAVNKHRQAALEKNLQLRAEIIQAIRSFFTENGYLEVETPYRIPAPAPEAHIDAQPSGKWYLHTSPELCMKRLLAAGYSQIFQICRCFRQHERGSKHLPELTMLEWYTAESTYKEMMDQCEALIRFIARKTGLGKFIIYQGHKIDLRSPWSRITVAEAFDKFTSMTMKRAIKQNRFNEMMACKIEPELATEEPVFLFDYPASRGALARLKPDNRLLAERFELYIGGLELCNAFSELIDPVEQRLRFEKEQNRRRISGKTVYPMPQNFLESLDDMPEAAGNALGVDRLVMLFADTVKIDDVVAFTPEEL